MTTASILTLAPVTGAMFLGSVGPVWDEANCPDPEQVYAQCPKFYVRGKGTEEVSHWRYSDLAVDLSVADNFTLQEDLLVGRIRWWGTYLIWGVDSPWGRPPPADRDDFTVLLWGDDNGNPSGLDPIPVPGYIVSRLSEPVGEVPAPMSPARVFEYELVFRQVAFRPEPGQTYWLEVHNDIGIGSCAWVWVTAPSSPGDDSSRERSPSTDPNWSAPRGHGADLAFMLLSDGGRPEPPVPALPGWGLVVMIISLLTGGAIIFRRRVIPRRTDVLMVIALAGVYAWPGRALGQLIPRTPLA